MEKVSYRNIKLGEVSSPPPPAMYSSLYLKKNKYKFAKNKCNSSMTMHAIFKYFTNCSSKHSLQWNNEIYIST